jgi:choline dehydrogenase-like flavoprotein
VFIEFESKRDWSLYDVVIVGSGRIGLFLAERLARGARVLVIEAGAKTSRSEFGKGFYELESTGLYTEPLGTRLTRFGGTSHQWGAMSRALSSTVFENRNAIAAGWPISYHEFARYLSEAREWMGLIHIDDCTPSTSAVSGLLQDHAGLAQARFDFPKPRPDLVESWIRRFAAMSDIDVLTLARVSELRLGTDGRSVSEIEIVDRRRFGRHAIPVKRIILAAGGIENARLLLWSGHRYSPGNPLLGGLNELTGRYFMEHPVIWPLQLLIDRRIDLSFGHPHDHDGWPMRLMWTLSDETFARHRLLRFGVTPEIGDEPPGEIVQSDAPYLEPLRNGHLVEAAFQLEQSPTQDSFVALSAQRDCDGDPIARLHWQIAPEDVANYRRGVLLFGSILSQAGLVRARVAADCRGEDWSGMEFGRCHHHMGTTRMAHSPLAGVVDPNCRVFGLDNLYVAGTSVFPNGDFVNPTLNALALAARLAEHLGVPHRPAHRSFRFGAGRAASAMLVSGWSAPERLGVWTDGPEAVLSLNGHHARVVRLSGHAYADARVHIAAGEKTMFEGLARFALNTDLELDPTADPTIVFTFSNLTSPRKTGENDDVRRLGIFLSSIQLR